MFNVSNIMIPFETWGSISIIVFLIYITVGFIRRKINFKNLILSLILFVSLITFLFFNSRDFNIITNLHNFILLLEKKLNYKILIPFNYFIFNKSYLLVHEILNLLMEYLTSFSFALIFGVCFPLRYKKLSYKAVVGISFIMFFIFEIFFLIESYIGGSGCLFDTGNIFLIIIGSICGRSINKYISRKSD